MNVKAGRALVACACLGKCVSARVSEEMWSEQGWSVGKQYTSRCESFAQLIPLFDGGWLSNERCQHTR